MRNRHNSMALKQLVSGDFIAIYFLATFCLGFLVSACFDIYKILVGANLTSLVGLAVVSAALLVFAFFYLRHRLSRISVRTPQIALADPEKRRGLIVLVSNTDVARKAIQYHKGVLEHCWLIHSTFKRSMDAAHTIAGENNEDQIQFYPFCVQDVWDPREVKMVIDRIYQEDLQKYGLDETDVIADITGMTATASVGMALACLSPLRSLQYTPAAYNSDGTVRGPLDPKELDLTWDQITIESKDSEETVKEEKDFFAVR